jgi:hypothetical protein
MAKLLLSISNLDPHTHFVKRRHTLQICEVFFLSNSFALIINDDCTDEVIDFIWNLA